MFIEPLLSNEVTTAEKMVKIITDLNPDPVQISIKDIVAHLFKVFTQNQKFLEEVKSKLESGLSIVVNVVEEKIYRSDQSTVVVGGMVIRDPLGPGMSDFQRRSKEFEKYMKINFIS